MDIREITSGLKMRNLYFSECSVKRECKVENGECNATLEKNIEKIEEHKYAVQLVLSVTKSDLLLNVVANAEFELMCEDMGMESDIINTNTVAIMFPFIRSQVTLLTSQPGMTPIVLPPINTSKFTE